MRRGRNQPVDWKQKEEIRIRKDVAHEEEVVEENVRREEIDINDKTERRGTLGRDVDDEPGRRNL